MILNGMSFQYSQHIVDHPVVSSWNFLRLVMWNLRESASISSGNDVWCGDWLLHKAFPVLYGPASLKGEPIIEFKDWEG